jgi:hypothetical protein
VSATHKKMQTTSPHWQTFATGDGRIRSRTLNVSNAHTSLPSESILVLEELVLESTKNHNSSTCTNDADSANQKQQGISGQLWHEIDLALNEEESYYEGFHGPRRQCYSFPHVETAPKPLQQLHCWFAEVTGLQATEIHVEEYIPQVSRIDGASQDFSLVYTFPIHPGKDHTPDEIHGSFVAEFVMQVPFADSIVSRENAGPYDLFQAWNKPLNGHLMAWNIHAQNDWADVKFPLQTATKTTCIVRRGVMLREWRTTRILATLASQSSRPGEPPRIRVTRFLRLPSDRHCLRPSDSYFGHVTTHEDDRRREANTSKAEIPKLEELLTIVITTSPIPSNPDTALLENAMATFLHGGEEFAYKCRKVIMCDGVREGEAVSKKHATIKQAMRNGIVTGVQADVYTQYKTNIRRLAEEAGPQSTFANTIVVELEERHGFGYSLRHAVRNHVTTPYVCVVQHDRTFIRNTPVAATVSAMWRHSHIKYVGFNMKSNLTYRDTFQSKYGNGKHHQNEFDNMILRVPELCLSSADYGPGSRSIDSMKPKLREKVHRWARAYMESAHGRHFRQIEQEDETKCQLSLIPTLFWFDNTHICETNHYRDFIFYDAYRQVARGGFVEDKVSPLLKKTCERLGLRDGHSRYGCFLLDDHSGAAFTGHIDGGTFMPHLHQDRLGI